MVYLYCHFEEYIDTNIKKGDNVMALISAFPTFGYITWEGLIILPKDGKPYVISDDKTLKKYIYWERATPYQLIATDEKLETNTTRYLIYINNNGNATEVPYTEEDDISIQYREGSGVLMNKVTAQYAELDGKYTAIKQDVDGILEIVGSSEESEDGTIIDRINKLEKTSTETNETISRVETSYNKDKETEELRNGITSTLIAMATALSEYQETLTSACKDFNINQEEHLAIQESQNNMIEKANLVYEYHDILVTKIARDENIEEIRTLNIAKENIKNAIFNLNTNVNTCISDSTVVPSEITIMLDMFANVGVKANDYNAALINTMILGVGGEIIENIFSSTKTSTEFNQKISEIVEVIDGETGLKKQIESNATNINQTAEDIKLNYMKYNKVTSEITVSDNVIKLDAGQVLMTGTLTWDSLSDDAKNNLKGEKGDNGNAQYVMLTGDQIIKYDSNGNAGVSSIMINTLISGISDSPSIIWKYKAKYSNEWKTIASNNNRTYYSLPSDDVMWNNHDTITIRAIVNNDYYDDLTVVKVKDGLDGSLAEYVELVGDNVFKYSIKKGETVFTPTPSSITLIGKQYNINTTNTKWYYKKPNQTEWTLMSSYNGNFELTIQPNDTTLFNDTDVVQIKFELNTHSDIITISKLYDGKDSVVAMLSNENHIIPCKSDGTPIETAFDNAQTSMEIYVAGINDTINWNIIISDSNGLTGEFIEGTNIFKVTNVFEDTAYIDFMAIPKIEGNFDSITKRFTLSKSKNGLDGSIGEDSISYWFNTSASIILKSIKKIKNEEIESLEGENEEELIEETELIEYSPSILEVNAKQKEGKKEIVDSQGIFKIYEKIEENWIEKYVSASNESSCSYELENPLEIKVEFYIDDILIDEEYIPVLTDTETTPIAFLDNDSHIIPCNFNGMPLNYEGATTTMNVYIGNIDDSENWSYTFVENNLSGVINNRTYQVTNITNDIGYIDITAKKEDFEPITKRFTVAKSKNGEDGESAKYIYITGEQIFKYEENFEGEPTPNFITLTANKYNISTEGKWQYKDGDKYIDTNITTDTINIYPTDGIFSKSNICTYRYIVEELYDEMTIIKVSNGSNGLPGSDGEDGIYILLSNEAHIIPCATDGTYSPEELSKASTEVRVFRGADEINFDIQLIGEGCTPVWNQKDKTVSVTEIHEDTSKVIISITVGTQVFTKHFVITKSMRGAGINIIGTVANVESLPNDGNPGDAYLIGNLLYIWSENEGCWSEGVSVEGIKGKDGLDGTSTYLHIKYSNDGKTFTSAEGETIGDWIGQYIDNYEEDSTVFTDYKWKKIKGEDGESGIVATLSNDTHTIPCSADGMECNFIGCNSKISLFYGTNEITQGVSYSFNIVEGSGGTGVQWDSSTGTIRVTEMINVDVACIDLIATYNGLKYTKRFTVTKNRQGADAITINLSNENHSFVANSEGRIEYVQTVKIQVTAFKNNTPILVTLGGIENVNGLNIQVDNSESAIILTTNVGENVTQLAQSGIINIPITVDGTLFTKEFTYTRVDCGKDGQDGTDGYTVMLTNESHSFYCESNGTILDEQTTTTNVKALYGHEERTPIITSITNIPEGLSVSKNGSTVTIKTIPKAPLLSSGSFNIEISVDGRNFVKVFSWSKAFKGINGLDGENARYVVVNGDQIFKYEKGSNISKPSSIILNATKFGLDDLNGKWQYKTTSGNWIDTGSTSTALTITPTSGSLANSSTCTFRYIVDDVYDEITIAKISDGQDGTNGTTFYTWIMYADDEKGNGISNNPTNKKYIGLSYNNTVSEESTDPSRYSWSLIKGTDGIPGVNGMDGVTYYTWIKYSDDSTGKNMYDTPTSDTQYIGIATNKTTQTESTNKSDYVWSKFRGDDGVAGKDAYTVLLTNENHSFICENNGNIKTESATTCQVLSFKGNTAIAPTIGTITAPSGLTITKSGTTITIIAKTGTALAESGTVNIPITIDGISFSRTFSWVKVPKGEKGDTGSAANIPSWIEEWDSGKTTINGSTVLTPKLFAGSISTTGNKPTGVAIGENVFGTSGTYSNVNGIVGYKNGTKTYEFNINGEILFGSKNGYYFSWDGSSLDMNLSSLTVNASDVATQSEVNTKIAEIKTDNQSITTKVSNLTGELSDNLIYNSSALLNLENLEALGGSIRRYESPTQKEEYEDIVITPTPIPSDPKETPNTGIPSDGNSDGETPKEPVVVKPPISLPTSNKTRIHFILTPSCGDCILIETDSGKTILIDAPDDRIYSSSSPDSTTPILAYLNKVNITTLDYVICTHFHSDHAGALPTIMQKYCNKNSKFIYNNISDSAINSISKEVTWKTVTYKNNVLNMANTIGMTSTSPNANTTFTLDDNTSFKICKIGSTSGLTDYNGYSLAIVFIYKGRRILLSGDINPTTQNQLISAIGQCDIVKDPHHGYNSKLDLDFCRNVNPKDIIVTRNHDWGTDYYRACNSVGMWQSYEKNIYALFHTNNHIVIDFIGNDYVISTSNKFYFEKCWHKFNNDNNCWCYFKQGGQCAKNETLVLNNQKRYDFNGNGFCTNPYNPY